MINDKQLKAVVAECMEFIMDGHLVDVDDHEKSKIAKPEWSCWKTGLELSCYGVKLLRVCQLTNTPFYGCPEGTLNEWRFVFYSVKVYTKRKLSLSYLKELLK